MIDQEWTDANIIRMLHDLPVFPDTYRNALIEKAVLLKHFALMEEETLKENKVTIVAFEDRLCQALFRMGYDRDIAGNNVEALPSLLTVQKKLGIQGPGYLNSHVQSLCLSISCVREAIKFVAFGAKEEELHRKGSTTFPTELTKCS